jgi:hypothetical protein
MVVIQHAIDILVIPDSINEVKSIEEAGTRANRDVVIDKQP